MVERLVVNIFKAGHSFCYIAAILASLFPCII
jgi:hypothetical protein